MAPETTLVRFLQTGLPNLQALGRPGAITRSLKYSYRDINSVSRWDEFNIESIQRDFGAILESTLLPEFPATHFPHPVHSEMAVKARIDMYLSERLIQALYHEFEAMRQANSLTGITPLTFDVGAMARKIEGHMCDVTF